MLQNSLPQTEDGEDDSVLDDRCKDAQDAGHNKCLNSIETCGGWGGGIGSVGYKINTTSILIPILLCCIKGVDDDKEENDK